MPRYSRETIATLKRIGKTTEQSRFKRGMENPLDHIPVESEKLESEKDRIKRSKK